MPENLLTINNLEVAFNSDKGSQSVIKNISFNLKFNEILALVGESGSGKTVTAQSIIRLYSEELLTYLSGSINFSGTEILGAQQEELQKIRGGQVGMIFQEPMSSLNPLHKIYRQISESMMLHRKLKADVAMTETIELLSKVGLENPMQKSKSYPHQLSGGERQRVMIAMALANKPKLLIADEPTTSLDLSLQSKILDLLLKLKAEYKMSVLFITHDLSIVKKIADRVVVMRNGIIEEEGSCEKIFTRPESDYTKFLIGHKNSNNFLKREKIGKVILSAKNISVAYPIRNNFFEIKKNYFKAVDSASLELKEGQCLGIAGESGSGKTTLGKAILRLIKSEGELILTNINLNKIGAKELRKERSKMQIVFQDPFGSLNPRMSVFKIIEEGLTEHFNLNKLEIKERLIKVMQDVQLDPEFLYRYPHQFSGGQRQRIALARVLVLNPKILVLDEPSSSLDKAIQMQVIELLQRLQSSFNLSYIFISHDLKTIRELCHDVIIMKEGKIIEEGSTESIFKNPKHKYTKELLASIIE